jgi:hypothetical protein
MENIEFIGFRADKGNLYAKDNQGAIWLRVGHDEWEKIEEPSTIIKQGLTYTQLLQVMRLNSNAR